MSKEIQISFLPKQHEAFLHLRDSSVTELLYGGAAGAGKSDLGCSWIITMALSYPGTRWLIGRSKLGQLKTTTMKTFRDVLKRMDLKKDVHYFWSPNSNEIRFSNHSEIILKDLYFYPSDPEFDSLGSLEITGAFVDEASQITEKAYTVLKSRMRYKLTEYKLSPKLLMTCNPSKNFLFSKFYKPFHEGTLPSHMRFVPALPKDNHHLPASYISMLDKLEINSRKRLRDGIWEYDDDPAAMIPYDNILQIFDNCHIETPEGTKLKDGSICKDAWMTVDPAYTGGDSTVILVFKGLKVIDTFHYSGEQVSNDRTIQRVKEHQIKYSVPSKNITIDVGGGYGNSIWEALPGSNRFLGSSSAISKEYLNLRTQCFYKLSEIINDHLLWFDTDDEQLKNRVISELEQLKRDKIDSDSKLRVVSKSTMRSNLESSPDFLDALAMRMYPLLHQASEPLFMFSFE